MSGFDLSTKIHTYPSHRPSKYELLEWPIQQDNQTLEIKLDITLISLGSLHVWL